MPWSTLYQRKHSVFFLLAIICIHWIFLRRCPANNKANFLQSTLESKTESSIKFYEGETTTKVIAKETIRNG